MSELVSRLAQDGRRVVYRPRRDDARGEFRDAVDLGYVHLLFPETSGGTELGFRVDRERSDLTAADWENGQGSVHLEGELSLDGVRVRCVADLDVGTAEGTGRLVVL